MRSLSNALAFVAVAIFLTLSGCGQGKFAVKPAKGKVVAAGKPVTSGSVTFIPVGNPSDVEAGKPASGAIAEDGTFVSSTFNRFDGAIVGKHRVQYVGAEDEDSEEEGPTEEESTSTQKRPASNQQKPQYVQNGEIIVEVTASGPATVGLAGIHTQPNDRRPIKRWGCAKVSKRTVAHQALDVQHPPQRRDPIIVY